MAGIKTAMRQVQATVIENSPIILTSLGCVGMVTTVVFAVRATPRAIELIQDKAEEVDDNRPAYLDEAIEKIGMKESVKAAWSCYIPTVAMGTVTIACFIGAHKISATRNAALAGLYSVAEKTLTDYQTKVVEKLGEDKHKEIQQEIAQDQVNENPANKDTIVMLGDGKHLVYDALSGRYFRSDINTIKAAVNDCNQDLLHELFLDLNDFYYRLGLNNVQIGNDLGWNTDHLIDIDFKATVTEDGTPCLVMDYKALPRGDFRKYC